MKGVPAYYKGLSANQWAKKLGITQSTISARMTLQGLTLEQAVAKGGATRLFDGKSYKQWCSELGVSYTYFTKRVRQCGGASKAAKLIRAIKKKRANRGFTLLHVAKKCGITSQRVSQLRHKGMTLLMIIDRYTSPDTQFKPAKPWQFARARRVRERVAELKKANKQA